MADERGTDPGVDDSAAEDPWQRAAGHVGAAPAPHWDTPAPADQSAPPPHTDSTARASQPAPPHASRPAWGSRSSRVVNPYAAPAFDDGRPPPRRSAPFGAPPIARPFPYRWGRTDVRWPVRSGRARWSGGAPTRRFHLLWLAATVVTFGLASLPVALVCWVRAITTRRMAGAWLRTAATPWLVSAVVWTLIAVGAYTALSVAGHTSSSDTTSSAPLPAPVVHKVGLGTTVTVDSQVATGDNQASVPVRLTASDVHRDQPGRTTVGFTVCDASTSAIVPLAVVDQLTLQGPDTTTFSPDAGAQLPDACTATSAPGAACRHRSPSPCPAPTSSPPSPSVSSRQPCGRSPDRRDWRR